MTLVVLTESAVVRPPWLVFKARTALTHLALSWHVQWNRRSMCICIFLSWRMRLLACYRRYMRENVFPFLSVCSVFDDLWHLCVEAWAQLPCYCNIKYAVFFFIHEKFPSTLHWFSVSRKMIYIGSLIKELWCMRRIFFMEKKVCFFSPLCVCRNFHSGS